MYWLYGFWSTEAYCLNPLLLKEFRLIETLIVGASTSLPVYGAAHKLNYFSGGGKPKLYQQGSLGKWYRKMGPGS